MQVHHEWDKIWALDYNSVAENSFQSQEAQFFLPKEAIFLKIDFPGQEVDFYLLHVLQILQALPPRISRNTLKSFGNIFCDTSDFLTAWNSLVTQAPTLSLVRSH